MLYLSKKHYLRNVPIAVKMPEAWNNCKCNNSWYSTDYGISSDICNSSENHRHHWMVKIKTAETVVISAIVVFCFTCQWYSSDFLNSSDFSNGSKNARGLKRL